MQQYLFWEVVTALEQNWSPFSRQLFLGQSEEESKYYRPSCPCLLNHASTLLLDSPNSCQRLHPPTSSQPNMEFVSQLCVFADSGFLTRRNDDPIDFRKIRGCHHLLQCWLVAVKASYFLRQTAVGVANSLTDQIAVDTICLLGGDIGGETTTSGNNISMQTSIEKMDFHLEFFNVQTRFVEALFKQKNIWLIAVSNELSQRLRPRWLKWHNENDTMSASTREEKKERENNTKQHFGGLEPPSSGLDFLCDRHNTKRGRTMKQAC